MGHVIGASPLGTCSCFPQWCKKDSGDSVRLAPGCDVSFRVAPAPLSLSEEVYLMGLWRHLTPEEAAHPSPARDWLARCDPNLSPDQAYCQYQEISREDRWAPFSFGNAWSTSHRDHPAIKRAICQMPIPKLERMVLIRFQGLHPPWVSTAEWEFLMWFAPAVERDRSWSAAWQHTDAKKLTGSGPLFEVAIRCGKIARGWSEKHISKSKWRLFEVAMWKSCTPL